MGFGTNGGMNGVVRGGRQRVFPERARARARAMGSPEEGTTDAVWACKASVTIALPLQRRPASGSDVLAIATTRLRKHIERWIDGEGLRSEIGAIDELSKEGAVAIRCSSRAKRRLREQFIATNHAMRAAITASA